MDNQRGLCRFWGKTDRNTQDPAVFHPAIYHMLDVANVARVMLTDGQVSSRWRKILAEVFHAPPAELADWLPYLVSLHDIGKISAAFQGKDETQKARLIKEGVSFKGWSFEKDIPHSRISQIFVMDAYDNLGMSEFMRNACYEMLGGHHGYFNNLQTIQDDRIRLQNHEPKDWQKYRVEAARILAAHLHKDHPLPQPSNLSTAIMSITGFSILCDWLGSNSDFFQPSAPIGLEDYVPISIDRARAAVEWAAFRQPSHSIEPTAFASLFSDIQSPRPLQTAVDEIPQEILSGPCLAIIEAPTGEGKTEAALALAHRLAQQSGTDEFYYALPTTATSNQMFNRVQKHLRARLKIPTQTKLVHGQAFLVEDDLRIAPLTNGTDMEYTISLDWFAPLKRSLLAPFGVGTIDQAELAALSVKHVPLRLMGLAGKTVILDEVHAYDTYMSTIIERLLEWLSAMGTSVILLSATLPMSRRAALAHAYGLDETIEPPSNYPSLWVIGRNGHYHATPAASQSNRRVQLNTGLHFGDNDAEGKAHWLLEQVLGGGCVCWITNTVERAQKMFEIVDRIAPADLDRTLLHARFPLQQRQDIEGSLISKYGPTGERPGRGIVVGTQVLEQSLDLDFDVMVSDLAPVDLLLQRSGRLHRHHRRRPEKHTIPCLWINTPSDDQDKKRLGVDALIYEEYILRRTWRTLCEHPVIALPGDYRPLVEFVYADIHPAKDDGLFPAWDKMDKNQIKARDEAKLRILSKPNARRSFVARTTGITFLEEEDGKRWIVAQTRLGEETVNVIPMHKGTRDATLVGTTIQIALNTGAPREVQLAMLQQSIRVGKAVQEIKEQHLPAVFQESALLKGVYPLWLENGESHISTMKGELVMKLDPQLGLLIKKGG